MNNETDAVKPGRLLQQLLAGQRPDAAPLDEVAEVLAGGVPDWARTKTVEEKLLKLHGGGLLKLDDTGRKNYVPNPVFIGSFRQSNTDLSYQQRRGEQARSDYASRVLSSSSERAKTTTTALLVGITAYSLRHSELLKVADLLRNSGNWPANADFWCGVGAVAAVVDPAPVPGSQMSLKAFRAFATDKFKGNLTSVFNDRNKADRKSPYKEAFNEDGTVNRDKFVAKAIERFEWDEGQANLVAVASPWVSGAAKRTKG